MEKCPKCGDSTPARLREHAYGMDGDCRTNAISSIPWGEFCLRRQLAAALDDAISAALAALDESPCVWMEDGGRVIKTTCGHYWQTLDDGDRVDFPYCPFCRRKIADAPLPAAPEVKP